MAIECHVAGLALRVNREWRDWFDMSFSVLPFLGEKSFSAGMVTSLRKVPRAPAVGALMPIVKMFAMAEYHETKSFAFWGKFCHLEPYPRDPRSGMDEQTKSMTFWLFGMDGEKAFDERVALTKAVEHAFAFGRADETFGKFAAQHGEKYAEYKKNMAAQDFFGERFNAGVMFGELLLDGLFTLLPQLKEAMRAADHAADVAAQAAAAMPRPLTGKVYDRLHPMGRMVSAPGSARDDAKADGETLTPGQRGFLEQSVAGPGLGVSSTRQDANATPALDANKLVKTLLADPDCDIGIPPPSEISVFSGAPYQAHPPPAENPVQPGVARPMDGVEGFFAFNPLGKGIKGYAESAYAIVRSPLTVLEGAGNLASDAIGFGKDAVFGPEAGVMGDERPYQASNGMMRSLQEKGPLATAGDLIVGGVKSLPGVAQVDALYHGDPAAFGKSLPGALMAGYAGGQLSEIGGGVNSTASKLSFDSSLNVVDKAFAIRTGEILAEDPVGAASYARLQRQGTNVLFVSDATMPEMGIFESNYNLVTVNMLRHSNAEEAVSTIIHEATHQNGFYNGVAQNTQFTEYQAFRNESLFQNGARPSLSERLQIWRDVQTLYPFLPQGKYPFGDRP